LDEAGKKKKVRNGKFSAASLGLLRSKKEWGHKSGRRWIKEKRGSGGWRSGSNAD